MSFQDLHPSSHGEAMKEDGADDRRRVSERSLQNAPTINSYRRQDTNVGSSLDIGHIGLSFDSDPEGSPPATQSRPPRRNSDKQDGARSEYVDPSSRMWTLYLAESRKQDEILVKKMTADTNGVFTDNGTVAIALLAQISEQLAAASNGTQLPARPLPISSSFCPTSSALRQWARRYISHAQSDHKAVAPWRQGLIHAYLFEGLQTFQMKSAVEAPPVLPHASVVLFFIGLVEFLFAITTAITSAVLAYAAIGATAYIGLTIRPSKFSNSPYATPFSTLKSVFLVLRPAESVITALSHALDPPLEGPVPPPSCVSELPFDGSTDATPSRLRSFYWKMKHRTSHAAFWHQCYRDWLCSVCLTQG
ncbi:hypothetical protein BV25DRAFT_1919226 [Artomyces pyxidatus]|uniref:Uncharacterized protein n=1 Tax=Artomyces pyxidatus TaxID=48021 RepID=A0ACB8SQQ4_9AGAM|nr:hypothetical protein BV25DRAFT_1919226 [Artomyces pyxidatus]